MVQSDQRRCGHQQEMKSHISPSASLHTRLSRPTPCKEYNMLSRNAQATVYNDVYTNVQIYARPTSGPSSVPRREDPQGRSRNAAGGSHIGQWPPAKALLPLYSHTYNLNLNPDVFPYHLSLSSGTKGTNCSGKTQCVLSRGPGWGWALAE